MSPIRTGVDLASVDDVADALGRFGPRWAHRVLTPAEQAACAGADGTTDPRRAAMRLAVKEAVFKVLAPGDVALPWTAVEVRGDGAGGPPTVVLHGPAAELARDAGVARIDVDVAREANTVTAVAVARAQRA